MLKTNDKDVYDAIQNETKRQLEHIELIASENFVSTDVLEAQGSVMTNKYAEGYPGKRYYGGCEYVDVVENLAIKRVKQMFGAKFANVQPHSGSQANAAVYQALLKPNDLILGMSLNSGGHLTHGYKLNFSGKYYRAEFYEVDSVSELIDYEEVRRLAHKFKPQMIVAGASAYSKAIDFIKFREIADEVGAYLFVDMAHIAGLIVAGLHQNPLPYAHVVSSTTHKTLRGPRGGIILTNDDKIALKIDRALFPGVQGGPLMHVIAAKAVAFKEALDPSFNKYQQRVINNMQAMVAEFINLGYRLVSGGSDNHLCMIDVKAKHKITGLVAENVLQEIYITVNKNSLPFDQEKPFYTSGIRLGTAAMTTRGFNEIEFIKVARLIDEALTCRADKHKLSLLKNEVIELTKNYPIFKRDSSSDPFCEVI